MGKEPKGSIYLIDDDPGGIMSIVRSIFPAMWQVDKPDEGIETHICIFGNAATVTGSTITPWNTQDEEELARKIEDELWYRCNNWEQDNGIETVDSEECVTFENKVDLVRGKVCMLYKADATMELKDECDAICRIWTGNVTENEKNENKESADNLGSEGNQKLVITEKAKKAVQTLITRMKIPQNACVGLDLSLLWRDIERILEEKQPIISMQLYHLLSKNHECFLYSKYVMVEKFINTWKEVYTTYFEPEETPDIYQKSQLSQKEITDETRKKLVSMVNGQRSGN